MTHLIRWLLALSLVMLCALHVWSQTPSYPPFEATPEYARALSLVDAGRSNEGVALWLDIAARNPGTTLGARCLLQAAFYCNSDQQQESIYRSISSGYPNSGYDVFARQALINLRFGYSDKQGFAQATDALVRSFGAPGLADLQNAGDRGRLVQSFQALPQEIQRGLSVSYQELLANLVIQQERYEQALPLALFYRETLASTPTSDGFAGSMISRIVFRGGTWPTGASPVQRIDPQLKVKTPKEGQKKGTRPRFRARVKVGDFRYPQVALGQVQFQVDGQDRRGELVIRSKVDSKPKVGKVFEKLKLTWRPAQPLAHGVHTILLVVPTAGYQGSGPGIARATLTFTVRAQRDDEEDECDDNKDDWDDD